MNHRSGKKKGKMSEQTKLARIREHLERQAEKRKAKEAQPK